MIKRRVGETIDVNGKFILEVQEDLGGAKIIAQRHAGVNPRLASFTYAELRSVLEWAEQE